MKPKFSFKIKFAFKPVTEAFIKNIVSDLSKNKAASGDIPLNFLKESTFIFPNLVRCVNEALMNCEFPDPTKLLNIVTETQKKDPNDKTYYRPISVLSLPSKTLHGLVRGCTKVKSCKVMYEQLYEYNYLNELLSGFCKGCKKELDNLGLVGTTLMDLSKAYDCLPHDLLMTKVEACGLEKPSLNLVNDYLSFGK